MKSIVVWLWNENREREFAPEHVNTLQRAIARCLSEEHRFICVADSAKGLDAKVEFVETPEEAKALAALRSPEGERFPSCYRRLYNFSEGAAQWGDSLLCIDIDLVPMRDIAPLFDQPHDFVGWRPYRDWGRKLRFGGGIYLLKAGSRTHVWTDFKGAESILQARQAGFRGSDQAWISHRLGGREPYWGRDAGIYSVRDLGTGGLPPKDARIMQFNGRQKPWHYATGRHSAMPWVRKYWTPLVPDPAPLIESTSIPSTPRSRPSWKRPKRTSRRPPMRVR